MTTDNRANEPTEAQVEAAAKAIADCHNPGMFEKYPENWRVEARAALVAAQGVAPHAEGECDNHRPVQHRDGKPPWCRVCGLDARGNEPESRLGKPEPVAPQPSEGWPRRNDYFDPPLTNEQMEQVQQCINDALIAAAPQPSESAARTNEQIVAEAMVGAGAPLMHSRVEEAVVAALREAGRLAAARAAQGAAPVLPSSGVDEDALAEVLLKHSPSATDSGGFAACRCDRTWRSREGDAAHVARAVIASRDEWLKEEEQ